MALGTVQFDPTTPYQMYQDFGLYAIRVATSGGIKEILISDCIKVIMNEDNSIWYMPGNRGEVIQVVERWIYVKNPLALCFNDKPKTDEQKALDALPH